MTAAPCPDCGRGPAACHCDHVPEDGAGLLDELHAAFTRYVILPSPAAADAVTLWVAATHAQPAWQAATRLVISAPEKRCGKSRLLDIIEATCYEPLITVNISPAALTRSIGEDPPTILLDEADTVFGKKAADNHEELRGILNAGHQQNRPYTRWDTTARRRETCPTFAMAALAGIGSMPDTIEDRAVMIRMRRRAPGETVKPFRYRRDGPPLQALRDRLTAWVRPRLDDLTAAEPDMPVEDRAADNWESLVAVADAAGGTWPDRAREACRVLAGAADEDTTAGVRLLADLRDIFTDEAADALHGTTILDRLHKIEEAPWGDWFGRPLNARDLAKLLKPYEVSSTKVKISGKPLQGYRRSDLHDAWSRYLPPRESPGTHAEPPEPTSSEHITAVPVLVPVPEPRTSVPEPRTEPEPQTLPMTSEVPEVPEVPHTPDRPPCAMCGEPMIVTDRDQNVHPNCAP